MNMPKYGLVKTIGIYLFTYFFFILNSSYPYDGVKEIGGNLKAKGKNRPGSKNWKPRAIIL